MNKLKLKATRFYSVGSPMCPGAVEALAVKGQVVYTSSPYRLAQERIPVDDLQWKAQHAEEGLILAGGLG